MNDDPPINSEGKNIEELYGYKYGEILDISNTDAIIRGIENVKYEILSTNNITLLEGYGVSTVKGIISDITRCCDYMNIHFKQYSNDVALNKYRLQVIIPGKCKIPFELLTVYYLYVGRFGQINIEILNDNQCFIIKMKKHCIKYIYQNHENKYYSTLLVVNEVYKCLFYNLHTMLDSKMSKDKFYNDIYGAPTLMDVIVKFFNYKFYNNKMIWNMIDYGWNIKNKMCDIRPPSNSKLPNLFIPLNQPFSINTIFPMSFANDENFLKHIKTIELSREPFIFRCNKNDVRVDAEHINVNISLIDHSTYYDEDIFNTDMINHMKNLSIRGLGHVYNYVVTILLDVAHRQQIADIFHLPNDEKLSENILAVLDTI